MTIKEYRWERMKKDKEDYRRYEEFIVSCLKVTPLAICGYIVVAVMLAILGG